MSFAAHLKIAARFALVVTVVLAAPAFAEQVLAEQVLAEQTFAEQSPASPPAAVGAVSIDCARAGVSCRALESCAQACGYLHQCSLDKLDRDKDGIPCESLCKRTCDAQG